MADRVLVMWAGRLVASTRRAAGLDGGYAGAANIDKFNF
jgi:hypothetical protein